MRRATILLALMTVVAAACTTATPPSGRVGPRPGPAGPELFAAPALQPFDTCDEFLAYVTEHAIELVGPYGLEGFDGGPVPMVDVAFAGEDLGAPTTMAASGSAPRASATNVQVAGVDEPDLVKTDGERIFAVAQGRLFWIDTRGTPEIVADLTLDGWAQEMFLFEDRLLVLTADAGGGPVLPLAERSIAAPDVLPWAPRTVVQEVDVTDPSTMAVVRTLTMDGVVLAARLVDGTARIVIGSGPTGFVWEYPEGGGLRAEREATEANRRLVEESTLENWVPWYVFEDHRAGTTSEGPLLGCDQVAHPEEFSGLSMLTILTVDLREGLDPGSGVGLLADGDTVYASATNLYVATSPWMVRPLAEPMHRRGESPTTKIHMFDITDPETARYVASGQVEGTLLSQWSMDEYEGTLRVVVTDEDPWWGSSDVPDSSVVTLRRIGDRLAQVGSVGGLGKGERVQAVRFVEDRGYVVTFRRVDPLYVVDLSDPTDPRVAGELKITGYSAYLHPIGDHLLLGVGQDATEEGRTLGTQVAVFDVSDPTAPRRLAKLTFDGANSEVEWDHRAFLWWDGLAVLPMQRWSFDERTGKEDAFAGAIVLEVSPTKITRRGEVTHRCPGCGWASPIRRSLVIDDVLYTVSETGIAATDLGSLAEVAWIPFG
ncbi:MAG TPA: benzoate transporter [Actinobacteria bacterium]|nr:benzoate transporter [Actinomycetota bacterium]